MIDQSADYLAFLEGAVPSLLNPREKKELAGLMTIRVGGAIMSTSHPAAEAKL